MTAVCGGGTSSPKSGFQDPVFFTTTAIGAFFNAIPSPWLFDFASYLAPQQIDPAQFCSVDPPADPGITALDLAQLLMVGSIQQLPAALKVAQLFRRYLWYEICQCDSGPQPTPPAAPTEPAGAPNVNPPVAPPVQVAGCADITRTLVPSETHVVDGTAGQQVYDMLGEFLTVVGPNATRVTGHPQPTHQLPAGTTHVEFSLHTNAGGFDGSTVVGEMVFYNSAGTGVSNFSFVLPPNGGDFAPARFAVGATAVNAIMNWTHSAHANADVTIRVRFFCNGATNPTVPQPCPPDPYVQGLLNQILGLVTLIQRQAVPFAYVEGVTHSGLTGNGEIDVAPILGIRVLITSDTDAVGLTVGHPDTFWQAGWLRWGDASGFAERKFIDASPLTWFPQPAGQFTRIGYSLPPGVEIEIRELVREA